MAPLLLDLRFALRNLLKRPGFAAVAIVTLAIGIGANGAVASVVRALLLRPLPYAAQDRLVSLWSSWSDFPKSWMGVEEARAWGDAGVFEGVALFGAGQSSLTGGAEPERVGSAVVSPNLFTVLGVNPKLGRTFRPEEAHDKPAPVVMLSEELWRRRFGARPGLVGDSVSINGVPLTVVGIMPAGFKLPSDYASATPSELWTPFDEEWTGAYTVPLRGGSHNYDCVARLRSGVSVTQADARMRAVVADMTTRGIYPQNWHFGLVVLPVANEVLGPLRIALLVLTGAVGFVLLIACANVANLLLARGFERRKEFAVRMALGAAPHRLVGQLLVESGLLALGGGALGLWLAAVGVRLLRASDIASLPRQGEITVDGTVMAFVVVLALVTPFLFGLAPALEFARADLQERLKKGNRTTMGSTESRRFQSAMVASAVAFSMILLVGASLMVRTSRALSAVHPGFRADGVLTLEVAPARVRVPHPEQLIALYDDVLDRIRRLPGVTAAGAVRMLPLATEMGDFGMQVEGYTPPPGERIAAGWQVVTPGYFEALTIPVLAGRTVTTADSRQAPAVIVVSQSLAQRFWPGQTALGHRIKVNGAKDSPWRTVVGVVGDVLHDGLTAQIRQTWYIPQSQFDLSTGFRIDPMTVVIKTAGDPMAQAAPVRNLLRAVDPDLPAAGVRTFAAIAAGAQGRQRFTMLFLSLCSLLALLLAAVGIDGVVRTQVNGRRREIGLRMALGARRNGVVGRVVLESMGPVATGLLVGVLAALGLSRFLESLLFGVPAHDPATIAAAALCLGLVGLAASYFPALRAASVDPLLVLRDE
jgi:putative ABC transport system permease protein